MSDPTMPNVFEALGTAVTHMHQKAKEKDAIIEDLKGTVKAKNEEITKLHRDHDTAIGDMQRKFKKEKDAEIDILYADIANLKRELEAARNHLKRNTTKGDV